MKRKFFGNIISFALIVALSANMGVSAFADETNFNSNNTTAVESHQGFEYVIQTGNLSVQSANSFINGEVQETDNLLNLDNGLMLMLDSDTQVISNGYFGGGDISTESNIYSKDVYSASGGGVKVNHTVIAEQNIYLSGENVYGEDAILYSKNGDISINCNNMTDFKGIIYAPNGIITINGATTKIEGAIIGKEVYVQSNNFTINKNDSIIEIVDNIEYTRIDQLMGLCAFQDDDTREIVLQWNVDENISFVDIHARYGDEKKFNKLGTTIDGEYRLSADSLIDKADYMIVAHTKFGEEIQSTIATLVKNANEIHAEAIDSDGDGIPDGYEICKGLDPNNADTDGDGFSDGYEINILYTDPLVYDEDTDFDDDGLSNLQEMKLGTNPYLVDSDFDGISDSEDSEPMKTDPNSGLKVNYDVPIHTNEYDLVTRYVDDEGNKCESIYNYINGESKSSTIGNNKGTNVYDNNGNITAAIEYIDGQYAVNTYGYDSGNLTTITHNGFQYGFSYDENGNITDVGIGNRTIVASNYSEKKLLSENYGNGDNSEYVYDSNDNVIAQKVNGEVVYKWTYDENGNVLTYTDGSEDTNFSYTYDEDGNILKADEYKYTTGDLDEVISTKKYSYCNLEWKDLLTNFNGQDITYDEIGNPLSYRNGIQFTWVGRQLSSLQMNNNVVNYTYNSDGIRTSKIINGAETTYQLDETKIVSETTNGNIKWYVYDENNAIIGFEYNTQAYYFEKNAQGDVVRIFDSNGNFISEYFYDAWGNIAAISGNEEIANANPFRYRGYYYDSESGFYYLQSRYYDSFTGRFLNADEIISDSNILGTNLFAYCNNNAVNMVDPEGNDGTIIIMGIYFLACAVITICLTATLTSPSFINAWNRMCQTISGGISRGVRNIGVAFSWANSQAQSIARSIGLSFARVKTKPRYRSSREVHHIVAKAAKNAAGARNVLKNVGIVYQTDYRNLVSIKTGLHRRLHTNRYYEFTNSVVISAYNKGKNRGQRYQKVVQALSTLKGFILTMDRVAPF